MPLEHTPSRTRQQESEPNANTHERHDQSMELESVGMPNPTVGQLSLYATALQLPSFCKENPAMWFQQAEMAFALHRINSDETKFRYIALNLDNTALPFVIDLLSSPPAQGKYEIIKNRILASFDGTQESKFRKLLNGFEMGDGKPSNFLHLLRNLASGQCTDTVLWTLFMKKLPKIIRAVLIISSSYPIRDLDELATQADKIHEIIKHHSVAVVTNTSSQASPLKDQQIEELRTIIESLPRDVRKGGPRNRSRANYQLKTSPQLLTKGAFVLYTFSLIALTFTYSIFVRSSWSWT